MESDYTVSTRNNLQPQAEESDEEKIKNLENKMEELKKLKEELRRARDIATESWLDSKPLIDELESLKSELETAQKKCSVSNNMILELESQLETTVKDIRSKREEELKATKMINETNRALEQMREELEQMKAEKDEEHRARSKLKQTLRLRRQILRTLQLTLRAMRIESEGFGVSAAEALRYVNHPESDNSPVQLTQEDFYTLKKRAKEETALADWRVSVAMEQKVSAEKARILALRRLNETQSNNRSKRRKTEKITIDDDTKQEMAEDQDMSKEEPNESLDRGYAIPKAQDMSKEEPNESLDRGYAIPKARAKAIDIHKQEKPNNLMTNSKSRKNKEFKMKMKVNILWKIKSCLFRITRLFR